MGLRDDNSLKHSPRAGCRAEKEAPNPTCSASLPVGGFLLPLAPSFLDSRRRRTSATWANKEEPGAKSPELRGHKTRGLPPGLPSPQEGPGSGLSPPPPKSHLPRVLLPHQPGPRRLGGAALVQPQPLDMAVGGDALCFGRALHLLDLHGGPAPLRASRGPPVAKAPARLSSARPPTTAIGPPAASSRC